MNKRPEGVSVIICSYNSEKTITRVINCLNNQQFNDPVKMEVIVVNNNSNDNTALLVNNIIKDVNISLDLRIVFESNQGLIYARQKGIVESKYEFILFCDDDNLLSPNYVESVYRIFIYNNRVGACGGKGVALIKSGYQPDWFHKYYRSYAIGSQIKENQTHLFGAGLAIRYTALNQLMKNCYVSYLTGRKDDQLLSGEDGELTMAIKILGFKIVASDDFSFQHILPDQRLNQAYLIKLHYGFGIMQPVIQVYLDFIKTNQIRNKHIYFFLILIHIIKSFILFLTKTGFDKQVQKAYYLGAIKGIFLYRRDIAGLIELIKRLARNNDNI